MQDVDLVGANGVLPSVIYSNPAWQAFFVDVHNSSVNHPAMNLVIAYTNVGYCENSDPAQIEVTQHVGINTRRICGGEISTVRFAGTLCWVSGVTITALGCGTTDDKNTFSHIQPSIHRRTFRFTSLFTSKTCLHLTALMRWTYALTLLSTTTYATALEGPVGRLPAMGYNSWNAFQCTYNTSLLEAQAKMLHERGLVDAGYSIFSSDDCYALKERNSSGHMVADPAKFPEGIAAFSRSVQAYGMRLAAYGDNGYKTCGGYPGSYGHEMRDLETWYGWGMTYLKYDNCCECSSS
jgi:hypothetical protein